MQEGTCRCPEASLVLSTTAPTRMLPKFQRVHVNTAKCCSPLTQTTWSALKIISAQAGFAVTVPFSRG